MRMNRLILAAILASTTPLLSSCAAIGTAGSIASAVDLANQPADKVFVSKADEQAYYALLQFEAGANRLSITAVDMGFVKPGSPTAIKIADLLLDLTEVVNTAKAAKATGDAATLAQKIDAGRDLYERVMDLMA